MKQLAEIDDKIFEFAEKNSGLWCCENVWNAYEKRANEDESIYKFFEKRFPQQVK